MFHERPQMRCHKQPCGRETVTERVLETVTRACVKPKIVPVPTTVAIVHPIFKPFPVKCTVTEVETLRETVTCRLKPCPPKTFTRFVTHTKVQPCVIKETEVITKKVPVPVPKPFPVKCTYTTTETEVRTVSVKCTTYPCPKTRTTTTTEYRHKTIIRPCVHKETEVVTKVKPVPVVVKEKEYVTKTKAVMCTFTETKTKTREVPVECTKLVCKTKTLTDYIPVEVVRTCKETETATVTKHRPYPVTEICTVTETATKLRVIPVKCPQRPCKPSTVTEYIPVTKTKVCVKKETETDIVIKTKHHHHTETEVVTATKHHHHLHTTTKVTVCKVTETSTITHTRNKYCVVSCPPKTSTEIIKVTKTKPCVVTETLPIPYPVPKPYPYTKEIPVPYAVPVPVEKKVPVPCKEISCPPPPCNRKPCPPPPPGPCYEDPACKRPSHEPHHHGKPIHVVKRHEDDQSPTTPPVLLVKNRECDAHGVILRFDNNGLLRDQLNRIGYIADNHQFQFDLPVQAGGLGEKDFGEYRDPKTGDVFLTWQDSLDFYKCRSGDFDNLYTQPIAPYCELTRVMMFPCVSS